jgi:DNA-directed RNA polymerase specialized sigma24 family protein
LAIALGSMITAYAAIVGSKKEGLVEYVSAQMDIRDANRNLPENQRIAILLRQYNDFS